MITNFFLNPIWAIVSPILDRIPDISISASNPVAASVLSYIKAGLYFLPTQTVTAIFTIILALWILRVVVAFLHSLWNALPVV